MKSKNPAFLFYPDNWLGGTIGWDFDMQGAYLNVIIMQWNMGPLEVDFVRNFVGKRRFAEIKKKFTEKDGKLFNERLEIERQKALESSNKQRERIKKRWSKSDTAVLPRNYQETGNTPVIPLNLNLKESYINNKQNGGEDYKKQIDEIAQNLKADQTFIFSCIRAVNTSGTKVSEHWVLSNLDRFVGKLLASGDMEKTIPDFRKHFTNWLMTQPKPTPINNELY